MMIQSKTFYHDIKLDAVIETTGIDANGNTRLRVHKWGFNHPDTYNDYLFKTAPLPLEWVFIEPRQYAKFKIVVDPSADYPNDYQPFCVLCGADEAPRITDKGAELCETCWAGLFGDKPDSDSDRVTCSDCGKEYPVYLPYCPYCFGDPGAGGGAEALSAELAEILDPSALIDLVTRGHENARDEALIAEWEAMSDARALMRETAYEQEFEQWVTPAQVEAAA